MCVAPRLETPFGTRLSPMSKVRDVTYLSGSDKEILGSTGRI